MILISTEYMVPGNLYSRRGQGIILLVLVLKDMDATLGQHV